MTRMTNLELAEAMRHGLFADRGTDVRAAMRDAYDYIETIHGEHGDQLAAFTALHIVLNTISNVIKENEYENI